MYHQGFQAQPAKISHCCGIGDTAKKLHHKLERQMRVRKGRLRVHPKILAQIKKVTGKRPLTVINHILKHGQITTEELKDLYEYNHPPRARTDVLECGIPIETVRVPNKAGTRKIASYRFGNPDDVEKYKTGGRQPFSKAFKKMLYKRQAGKCGFTGIKYESRYLSIDHRIPYQVAGDQVAAEDQPEAFMLIALGLQRVKSWSCEHCDNSTKGRKPSVCKTCYWAHPEDHKHIAMRPQRRVDLVWSDEEIKQYDDIAATTKKLGISVADFIKDLLRRSQHS